MANDEPQPRVKLTDLRGALVFSSIAQVALLTLSALVFDAGTTTRVVAAAMVGYWLTVGWLVAFRRHALTQGDIILLRLGFFMYLPLTAGLWVVLAGI